MGRGEEPLQEPVHGLSRHAAGHDHQLPGRLTLQEVPGVLHRRRITRRLLEDASGQP